MVAVSQNMSIVYTLYENLDCNKICKDIENLLKKQMEQGPLNNCVLTISIGNILDSQIKPKTLYISHRKETTNDQETFL